jgi:hypothetical protein
MLEAKGKITSFQQKWASVNELAQIEISVDIPFTTDYMDGLDRLKDKDVKVALSPWRERRSLNANAYFHLLSDKLADAMRMSKPKMKNYLLFHYGQMARDEDGKLVLIKTNADEESLIARTDIHMWYYQDSPKDGVPMYVLLEHSRYFDSRQMSILIDGVVAECKAQGIETMTPNEIKMMKEKWNVEVNSPI